MNVLLTGAAGLIGSHLRQALVHAGHHVVGAGRHEPPVPEAGAGAWVRIDIATAGAADWASALQGIDAVVNAAGIFREGPGQRFDAVHRQGPCRLFDACVAAGVRRVLQVSALGADAGATTAYHLSKRAADEYLLVLPLDATVVQPSLVFGPGGASAALFLAAASLPLLPLPAGGRQLVQPVHIDDAVAAMLALLEAAPGEHAGRRIALVGPRPLSFAAYLQALRQALRLGPAPTLSVPAASMRLLARIGDACRHGLFDSAAWRMLQRGNAAPAAAITSLLRRPPREARHFVPPEHAAAWRGQAQLAWLLPSMRLSLAAVWIGTGLVSLGLYPVRDSYALLARTGIGPALQPLMLYGAALLDLALGVLCLWPMRQRRWLWMLQGALVLGYTLIISLRLPEFWLHPYGPLLKNLPILGLLLLLGTLEPRKESPWTT